VTLAVESPVLNEELRAFIAKGKIHKLRKKIPLVDWKNIPSWANPTTPNNEKIYKLSKAIAQSFTENTTVREISLLSHSVCSIFEVIECDSNLALFQFAN
jgi:hypothetical protein